MSTLRNFLSDVEPAKAGVTRNFWVWNDSTGIGNGGKCCLWTLPANKVNITFELWGGGGGGHGGCCCQFPNRPAAGGSYAIRTIQSTPGCQYTICAGGSTTCCCHGCIGGNGYPSFVTGSSIPTTCAPGGCGGKACCFTSAYTCHPSFVWQCGTGDWGLPQITGSSKRSQYCHNQMWNFVTGPAHFGVSRRTKDWCAGNFTNTGSCFNCLAAFPGGGGGGGAACGEPCCWGGWGQAGAVKVSYS